MHQTQNRDASLYTHHYKSANTTISDSELQCTTSTIRALLRYTSKLIETYLTVNTTSQVSTTSQAVRFLVS
ncbi:hypothetical protein VNO78_27440 [Psophocarpus tetragonolobus]|uniref:Uncharacterized protein n=1 Tax=Psophocarpus tetragonolobus TaxID=3891 RepID=A0AAN9S2R1_PSOTE